MLKLIKVGLVAVVMAMGAGIAWAGPEVDFNKGTSAMSKGNYCEAVRLFRKAATKGHGDAQQFLGQSYSDGRCLPENMVLAFMWESLAAMNGSYLRGMYLEIYSLQMTRAEISEAIRRASVCRKSNYRNCD